MESQRSSFYKLVEKQLGGSLADYVSIRRAEVVAGQRRPPQPWRVIAEELSEQIGVEVSYESLRSWFGETAEQVSA